MFMFSNLIPRNTPSLNVLEKHMPRHIKSVWVYETQCAAKFNGHLIKPFWDSCEHRETANLDRYFLFKDVCVDWDGVFCRCCNGGCRIAHDKIHTFPHCAFAFNHDDDASSFILGLLDKEQMFVIWHCVEHNRHGVELLCLANVSACLSVA